MTPEEFRFASRSFDDLLRNPRELSSAADFAEELEKVPAVIEVNFTLDGNETEERVQAMLSEKVLRFADQLAVDALFGPKNITPPRKVEE